MREPGSYSSYVMLIHNSTTDPHSEPYYEFSEGSRTYGCISTPYTDIVPTLNNDTVNATNNFPDDLYEQGLQYFEEGNISEAVDAVEGICARTHSLQDMIRTV